MWGAIAESVKQASTKKSIYSMKKLAFAEAGDDTTVSVNNGVNGVYPKPQSVSLDSLEVVANHLESLETDLEMDREVVGDEDFLPDAYFGSYPAESPAASRGFEVVIGPDDRVKITPTTSFPWRAICALRITARNGRKFIGTGWLISPRTVITAGHCVYLHNEGGWASSIEVIPALDGASRPYGSASSSNLRSVSGWTSGGPNADFDYGAIILPQNFRPGVQTGVFELANLNDAQLLNTTLNLSGYPGDKGGSTQWFDKKRTKSVSPRRIVYEIDTMGGQSGSPVWYLANGRRFAVGVHTNGSASGNSATRINASVLTNLQNWKALGA